MYQVYDPDSDTWTLFDDEKVRPLSRVNSHGAVGAAATKRAMNNLTIDMNNTGKGGPGGGLKRVGSRAGETAAAAAAAESDADADLLGSALKVGFALVL